MNRTDKFLRDVANGTLPPDGRSWSDEAREILDERLLIQARQIAADVSMDAGIIGHATMNRYIQGDADETVIMKAILRALRTGANFGDI